MNEVCYVQEILDIVILSLIFIMMLLSGILTFVIWHDCSKRDLPPSFMGLGFLFITLSALMMLGSQLVPIYHETAYDGFVLLGVMGLYSIWFHHEFTWHESLTPWKSFIGGGLFTSLLIIILGKWYVIYFHDRLMLVEIIRLFDQMEGLIALAIAHMTLLYPLRLGLREYRTHGTVKSFLEACNFLLLLGGIDLLVLQGFMEMEEILGLGLMAAVTSLTGLAILYLKEPRWLHRIPFPIYFLMGYHDSGLYFYRKLFQSQLQKSSDLMKQEPSSREIKHESNITCNDVESSLMDVVSFDSQNSALISSVLGAIDAIFKHAIGRELKRGVLLARTPVYMVVERDAGLRVAYVLIAQSISWYLALTLRKLLQETPRRLFIDIEERGRALDHGEFESFLNPIIKKLFPYFEMISLP